VDTGPEDDEEIQDDIDRTEKPKKRKKSGKGKEKAEETAQGSVPEKVQGSVEEMALAPAKEKDDGEMDIVEDSLSGNQTLPDPQLLDSTASTDIDAMSIAEDSHAFQSTASTDAEGMDDGTLL
jgi:hypothetical protein